MKGTAVHNRLTIKLNLDHAVAKRLRHAAIDRGITVSAMAQSAAADGMDRLPRRFRRAAEPRRRVLAFLDPEALDEARNIAADRRIPLTRALARAVKIFIDHGEYRPIDVHRDGHDLKGNRRYSAVHMDDEVYRGVEAEAAKHGVSHAAIVTAAVTAQNLVEARNDLMFHSPETQQAMAVTVGQPILGNARAIAEHAGMPLARVMAAAVEEGVRDLA